MSAKSFTDLIVWQKAHKLNAIRKSSGVDTRPLNDYAETVVIFAAPCSRILYPVSRFPFPVS
jgi:hypothetical protein